MKMKKRLIAVILCIAILAANGLIFGTIATAAAVPAVEFKSFSFQIDARENAVWQDIKWIEVIPGADYVGTLDMNEDDKFEWDRHYFVNFAFDTGDATGADTLKWHSAGTKEDPAGFGFSSLNDALVLTLTKGDESTKYTIYPLKESVDWHIETYGPKDYTQYQIIYNALAEPEAIRTTPPVAFTGTREAITYPKAYLDWLAAQPPRTGNDVTTTLDIDFEIQNEGTYLYTGINIYFGVEPDHEVYPFTRVGDMFVDHYGFGHSQLYRPHGGFTATNVDFTHIVVGFFSEMDGVGSLMSTLRIPVDFFRTDENPNHISIAGVLLIRPNNTLSFIADKLHYTGASDISTASEWARAQITSAINAGLVPEELQGNYQSNVTRGKVAQMFINLIEKASGMPIDDFMAEKGVEINPGAFADTNDKAVLAANALGIINGVAEGRFDPDGIFNRAQIAAIINRVARALGIDTSGYAHTFTDVDGHWVDAELGWPVNVGIVQGTGENRFNPNGNLTVEQAIAITYRALEPLSS
jgi:hypothetical protein